MAYPSHAWPGDCNSDMKQRIIGASDTPDCPFVSLSQMDPPARAAMLARYEREIYAPAFPDASIREDPAYWLSLLDATPYPPPPQPLIDVVMLTDASRRPLGGATIELYRTARSGLLTYLAVHPEERGKGRGRQLVALARSVLGQMGGEVPMFAETERLEDAHDAAEANETVLRQRRLAGLGARWVVFDYVMPPLRSDSAPHRLHLMIFDPEDLLESVSAATVAALIRELAAALGADLDAYDDTRAMMRFLDTADRLPIRPLPGQDGA